MRHIAMAQEIALITALARLGKSRDANLVWYGLIMIMNVNNMITFDDFKKLEIKIGKVVSAEKIPEADKLIRLVIDLGAERRQIIAGIAEIIDNPEKLVGKEMPVLVNLEPRKLRGYESQGMILAADVEGRPVLLHPENEVPPGSIVR